MSISTSDSDATDILDSPITPDDDALERQTGLLGVVGLEQLVQLLEAAAARLDKEQVDDQHAEGVPDDVQDVEAPAGVGDGHGRHVRVEHVDAVDHEVQVRQALGARGEGEYFGWVEGLHWGLDTRGEGMELV